MLVHEMIESYPSDCTNPFQHKSITTSNPVHVSHPSWKLVIHPGLEVGAHFVRPEGVRRVWVLLSPGGHLLRHRLVLHAHIDLGGVAGHVILVAQIEATGVEHAIHVAREEVILDGAFPGNRSGGRCWLSLGLAGRCQPWCLLMRRADQIELTLGGLSLGLFLRP